MISIPATLVINYSTLNRDTSARAGESINIISILNDEAAALERDSVKKTAAAKWPKLLYFAITLNIDIEIVFSLLYMNTNFLWYCNLAVRSIAEQNRGDKYSTHSTVDVLYVKIVGWNLYLNVLAIYVD